MSNTIQSEQFRQREMNPVTLKKLRDAGGDVGSPRPITHVFHVFEESNVRALCAALEADGFLVDFPDSPLTYEGSSYWKVEAARKVIPEVSFVDLVTDMCVVVASKYDADYDGWYTEIG